MPNFKSISFKMAVLQGDGQNLPSPCACHPEDPMWNRVKGILKVVLVVGMRRASFPTQSSHFAKSSDSEIFKFSCNSMFSISPEKLSQGKTDSQDQTDSCTDYVLGKAHALLL